MLISNFHGYENSKHTLSFGISVAMVTVRVAWVPQVNILVFPGRPKHHHGIQTLPVRGPRPGTMVTVAMGYTGVADGDGSGGRRTPSSLGFGRMACVNGL